MKKYYIKEMMFGFSTYFIISILMEIMNLSVTPFWNDIIKICLSIMFIFIFVNLRDKNKLNEAYEQAQIEADERFILVRNNAGFYTYVTVLFGIGLIVAFRNVFYLNDTVYVTLLSVVVVSALAYIPFFLYFSNKAS